MAYRRVGIEGDDRLEGFVYCNKDGEDEFVNLGSVVAEIVSTDSQCHIYYEDIPNLILALQAVYDYNLKGNT